MKLEIAVVGVQGAVVAAGEGADRIELCSALELGGLTPSQGLMESCLDAVAGIGGGSMEIHPLIRCRPGDFRYSDDDLATMVREIRALLAQGAHGVVIGALGAGNELDLDAARRLADAARGTNPDAELTFHRAVDETPDPAAAVGQLVELGFTRVLSSGGAADAGTGLPVLSRMVRSAAGQLQVMAGGGLAIGDIPLMRQAGVDAVHLSAKRIVTPDGGGSGSAGGGPASYMVTDREIVRAARRAVDAG
ncbi:copper homeostasis protein CutC [Arthrobacter sp. SW1]|uniref:copper homeostasis protein CutC n=1 Tax=Arthrobacter sp. SW1 TaxID=1920889 RepID=UPI000877E7BC|nr:copper homeostasis protein CutC [Arthrobacter sp. SW1]OFI37617.1 copper homeostasis protein CutC [Arthrobacter sp. SW1]